MEKKYRRRGGGRKMRVEVRPLSTDRRRASLKPGRSDKFSPKAISTGLVFWPIVPGLHTPKFHLPQIVNDNYQSKTKNKKTSLHIKLLTTSFSILSRGFSLTSLTIYQLGADLQ